jgi:hypothetical protein
MTNRTVHLVICSALGLALASTGRAFAQDAPAEGTPPASGDASTPPPAGPSAASNAPISATEATLHQGGIAIDGDVVINLSKDNAFKPIQIVPNLYYGVSDELTVGFAHNPGAEIFQAAAVPGGSGLCLSGTSGNCAHFYNGFSLDALFSFLRSSTMDLAGHGGLDFLSLSDPFKLSLRLGVKGKMMAGPVMVVFDPSLNIGLNNRNQNKEVLQVPVRVGYMVMPQLNVGLSFGIAGQLDGFGDNYAFPIGIGATYMIGSAVDVRAQFALNDLAGHLAGPGGGAADIRTISVGAAYHM